MNQRIRELAEQSGFFPVPDETEVDWEYRAENARYERFANLIIEECLSLFPIKTIDDPTWSFDSNGFSYEVRDIIEKHFGVE